MFKILKKKLPSALFLRIFTFLNKFQSKLMTSASNLNEEFQGLNSVQVLFPVTHTTNRYKENNRQKKCKIYLKKYQNNQ